MTDPPADAATGPEAVLGAILPMLGEDQLKGKIEDIKAARKVIQDQKKKLTNQIRNEQRKRNRLVKRSAGLKTAELLTVLRLREQAIRAKKPQTLGAEDLSNCLCPRGPASPTIVYRLSCQRDFQSLPTGQARVTSQG